MGQQSVKVDQAMCIIGHFRAQREGVCAASPALRIYSGGVESRAPLASGELQVCPRAGWRGLSEGQMEAPRGSPVSSQRHLVGHCEMWKARLDEPVA